MASYKNQGAGYASGTDIDQGAYQGSGVSATTTSTTTTTSSTTSTTTTSITATTSTTLAFQHIVFVIGT